MRGVQQATPKAANLRVIAGRNSCFSTDPGSIRQEVAVCHDLFATIGDVVTSEPNALRDGDGSPCDRW